MIDNTRVAPVVGGVVTGSRRCEGVLSRKPWEYPLTVAIPHRDTPAMLEGVIALLRAQRVRPYLLVIDTGSGPMSQQYLDILDRDDDVEVHHVRSKAWRCIAQPVAAAMDLAFAVCQTERLLATHCDVFPTSPDMTGDLAALCDARTPVVGWQMCPRPLWPDHVWTESPSHAATCYHMPTMRAIGATWNILRAFERIGIGPHDILSGYPDTETAVSLTLADHHITRRDLDGPDDGGRHWLCMGPEVNEVYATKYFHHIRATASAWLYHQQEIIAAIRIEQCEKELDAIPDRLVAWGTNGQSHDRADSSPQDVATEAVR